MLIRKAIVSDAEKIAYVHVKSWQTTYENILPQKMLANLSYEQRTKQWVNNIKNGKIYVAEDTDKKIVGFSTGGKERTGNYPDFTGELYAIYILEEFQRQGIGRQLLRPVLNDVCALEMTSVLVWVLEHNPAAEFYKAMGGVYVDKTNIEMAGKSYQEFAYGWKELPRIE